MYVIIDTVISTICLKHLQQEFALCLLLTYLVNSDALTLNDSPLSLSLSLVLRSALSH